MFLLELLYVLTSLGLALYGLNSLYLLGRFWRIRRLRPAPPPAPVEWPRVTVQLPIYNEIHTVERLLRAVARLDYPCDRLEVQVLDDSTDATGEAVARLAAELRAGGLQVVHARRANREGYKAGALAAGLRAACT
ncbi:MAG: glycosyltransferase [Chloroflexi bacterium]|nr:glycosyltransferase [Chloroflexota bacterium]